MVSTIDTMMIAEKEFPMIFSASSLFPLPSIIEALGAAPMLTSAAKAVIKIMMGKVTPTPVRASAPTLGIRPMNIRSTML